MWDYKHHQQFVINENYFHRLVELSRNPIYQSTNNIDNHFLEEGIFLENDLKEEWGWDKLSQIFHIGTKDIPLNHTLDNDEQFVQEYIHFCEENLSNRVDINTEKSGILYELPKPNLDSLKKDFLDVLKERMTSRFFYKTPLSLEEVSNLLYATFGQIHGSWKELESLGLQPLSIRKSSPSAGGLHSSEAYILAFNITGLPQGIYHYRSHQHILSLISTELDISQLGRLLVGQSFAENLPLGIFITSRLDKLWDKYHHSRAYRVALLDIGHLSQTFQLCSTALGLESWFTGMFLDTEINQLLKIEHTSEQVMFFVGAGKGKRQFLDEKMLKFLNHDKQN